MSSRSTEPRRRSDSSRADRCRGRCVPLNPRQAEAFKALRWLFSNEERDRRSGRTYVLALAYIHRSLTQSGMIEVEDHHSRGRDQDRFLLQQITSILGAYGAEYDVDGRHRFRVISSSHSLDQLMRECFDAEAPRSLALVQSLTDTVIWMSGSADFGEGGQAHAGWQDFGLPRLQEALEWLSDYPSMPETPFSGFAPDALPAPPEAPVVSRWQRLAADD